MTQRWPRSARARGSAPATSASPPVLANPTTSDAARTIVYDGPASVASGETVEGRARVGCTECVGARDREARDPRWYSYQKAPERSSERRAGPASSHRIPHGTPRRAFPTRRFVGNALRGVPFWESLSVRAQLLERPLRGFAHLGIGVAGRALQRGEGARGPEYAQKVRRQAPGVALLVLQEWDQAGRGLRIIELLDRLGRRGPDAGVRVAHQRDEARNGTRLAQRRQRLRRGRPDFRRGILQERQQSLDRRRGPQRTQGAHGGLAHVDVGIGQ